MINVFDIPDALLQEINKVISPTHIDVDGEMKHRYNSEGNLIHHTEDGIRNFHRWFGNSKVVDSQGRPKVVYHGTQRVEKETKKHDIPITTFKSHANLHWFSDNTSVSDMHAGKLSNFRDGSTIPVYIRATNHFDATKLPEDKVKNPHGVFNDELKRQAPVHNRTSLKYFKDSTDLSDSYKSPDHEGYVSKPWDLPQQSTHLSRLGFDSIKSHMSLDGYYNSPTIGVFHASQIKSAIGNDGMFDHPNKINESTDELKFHQDNPGGEWLAHKQEDAEYLMDHHKNSDSSLGKGISGSVTGYFSKKLVLPVNHIKNTPGAMGEENYVNSPENKKMDLLKSEIGSPEKFDSENNPIFIAVNHKGDGYTMEGNHRLAYAVNNGISHIHAEVRYFNGGEDVDGPMHPSKLISLHKE